MSSYGLNGPASKPESETVRAPEPVAGPITTFARLVRALDTQDALGIVRASIALEDFGFVVAINPGMFWGATR